jgi:hypothetical protein
MIDSPNEQECKVIFPYEKFKFCSRQFQAVILNFELKKDANEFANSSKDGVCPSVPV